jgi:hypothetical protein
MYWVQEVHLNTNTYTRLTTVIPATQKAEIKRIKIQGKSRQIVLELLSRKYSKQNRAKRVPEMVEYLPRMHVALNSNPSTNKKQMNK